VSALSPLVVAIVRTAVEVDLENGEQLGRVTLALPGGARVEAVVGPEDFARIEAALLEEAGYPVARPNPVAPAPPPAPVAPAPPPAPVAPSDPVHRPYTATAPDQEEMPEFSNDFLETALPPAPAVTVDGDGDPGVPEL